MPKAPSRVATAIQKSTVDMKNLQTRFLKLQKKVSRLEKLEQKYRRAMKELTNKEAFNFALFNYNPVLTVVVDREGKVVKSNRAKQVSGDRLPNIGDIMYKDYASRHKVNMHAKLIACIRESKSKCFPELRYGKKIISVTITPFPQGAIITSQDITEQKKAENDRIHLINDLRRALQEVETLRGLLPICAGCKKIRDDTGYWNHIEDYIGKRTLADFTHTMCPGCMKEYYPEFWEKMQQRQNASDTHDPKSVDTPE